MEARGSELISGHLNRYSTMTEVEKPWEFKEEVDIMEEEEQDDTGALHTRRNRKNKQAADSHGEPPHPFNLNAAAEEEEEQKQSVFLDSTNGE
jgi:hypothetical protein